MRQARAQGVQGVVLLVALSAMSLGPVARAQVRDPEDTISAGEDAGPLSDVSRPLGDDSTSVHDGALTVGETSGGPMRSGPVHDGSGRSMVSGPVSDLSQGPMTEPRPPLTSGAVAEASAGAVTHDIASPLGERISEPLRELGALQKQMRARREQAEQAALAGGSEPAAAPVDETTGSDEVAMPEEAAGAPEDERRDVEPGSDPARQRSSTDDEGDVQTGAQDDALPATQ